MVQKKKRKSGLRPLAAKMLSKYGGLTNRKIAEVLNIRSGAAAGRAISRFGKVLESNRKLKILLPEIENKLAEKATVSVKC